MKYSKHLLTFTDHNFEEFNLIVKTNNDLNLKDVRGVISTLFRKKKGFNHYSKVYDYSFNPLGDWEYKKLKGVKTIIVKKGKYLKVT